MPTVQTEIEIAASPDAVYATAKDVEKFPEFMPDLESVRIVSRDGNTVTSEWVGVIRQFNRRLRWTEVDEWDDTDRICRFRQTAGDFTEYGGEWTFQASDSGTAVRLTVDYRYDVPLVGAIIQGVLAKLMRQNADNMLQAIKQKCEA